MAPPNRVEHIVAMKLKRPFSDAEKLDIRTSLKSIPGVVEVSSGENYTERGQGFNNAIVVKCVSKEAERAYQSHAEHVRVRDTIIKPLCDSSAGAGGPICVVDYEFHEPQCPIDHKGFMAIGALAGLIVGGILGRARL